MAKERKKQRNTLQREVLQDVLQRADRPLTVHEIYEKALAQFPGMGMATVYRTVKRLLEAGTIQEVQLPSEGVRYETKSTGHHHHHFHCQSCENVFCLEHCPVSLPENTLLPEGFLVKSHDVTLYGLCETCQKHSES